MSRDQVLSGNTDAQFTVPKNFMVMPKVAKWTLCEPLMTRESI